MVEVVVLHWQRLPGGFSREECVKELPFQIGRWSAGACLIKSL